MLYLRCQPVNVASRHNVQSLLSFEEPRQFNLFQQIFRITDEDPLEVYDQLCQRSVVLHVPRSKLDALQIPLSITYPRQF